MDNPVRFIDPDGRKVDDWFKDQDGMLMYSSAVKSQSDLGDGQTYLGASYADESSGTKTYYPTGRLAVQ